MRSFASMMRRCRTGSLSADLLDGHCDRARAGLLKIEGQREGLALAQLAPGPLAAQLAIYLGWVRFNVFGATLVAFAFILPSLLMVLALAAFYIRFGGLRWMQAIPLAPIGRCERRFSILRPSGQALPCAV